MSRPDVNQEYQYGVQSALGTGVACATLIQSDGVTFDAEWMERFFRPPGNKHATLGIRDRAYAKGVRSGPLDFNHYHTVLTSLWGHGTITNPVAGSYSYPFSPNSRSANTPKYLSYMCGDATSARKCIDAKHTGLTLTLAENEVTYSSPFIARGYDNGASLDTVTRTLAMQPVSVSDIDWFLDSTYGGIGGTKITDVVSGSFEIPDDVTPKFVQNTTYPSWAELVENAMEDARVSFVTEYNVQARAFYDAFNVDVKPTRYIQIKMTGDTISGGTTYLLKHNFAVKPEKPVERKAPSGAIYGYEFPFRIVDDSTMGRAMEATLVNTTSLE